LGLAVLALVGSARCSACRRPPGGVGRMSPTAPERPSPPNERLSHGTGRPRTSSWRRAPDPLGTTSSGYLGPSTATTCSHARTPTPPCSERSTSPATTVRSPEESSSRLLASVGCAARSCWCDAPVARGQRRRLGLLVPWDVDSAV